MLNKVLKTEEKLYQMETQISRTKNITETQTQIPRCEGLGDKRGGKDAGQRRQCVPKP